MSDLNKDRIQLMRIIDQLYSLNSSSESDHSKKSQTIESAEGSAQNEDDKEHVRELLRSSQSAQELESAIEQANKLHMEFEVSLGRRKLSKLHADREVKA